jgi:hypothetical protein
MLGEALCITIETALETIRKDSLAPLPGIFVRAGLDPLGHKNLHNLYEFCERLREEL